MISNSSCINANSAEFADGNAFIISNWQCCHNAWACASDAAGGSKVLVPLAHIDRHEGAFVLLVSRACEALLGTFPSPIRNQ